MGSVQPIKLTACMRPSGLATRRLTCRTRIAVSLIAPVVLLSATAAHADLVSTLGAVAVDADSVGDSSFDALTTDPAIRETSNGEWTTGSTITITAPSNFAFDTAPNSVTAAVTPPNPNRVDLGAGGGNPKTATPTATTIVFTVANPGSIKSTVSFSGIRLRATNCTGGTAGNAADITVTTSSGALNNVQFADVAVSTGATDHLAFATQPATSVAGSTLLPAVTIQDACGNTIIGDDRNVTLAVQSNPGSAALNGTASLASAGGVATWTAGESLDITVAATGYTLRASHDGAAFPGADTADTAAFDITPDVADHLSITNEPANTAAGATLLPVVAIQDQYNNTVTADDRNITLAIQNNPGTATLNGTASLATVNGIATWTGTESLDITVAANGYTLRASHDGAAFATSDTVDTAGFNIAPNIADHLAVTTQPANTTIGVAILPVITIQDQYNNTVAGDSRNITLVIQNDPSSGAASLGGVTTLASVNGVATWAAGHVLNISVAAVGYTLRASHDGAAFASSDTVDTAAFNITGGTADHLAFTTQPVNTVAGVALVPVITIQDQFNNTVTGNDRTITLTIQNNPGSTALNGTAALATVNGVATWTGAQSLDITVAASGYTLRASHDGAAFDTSDTVDSAAFNITTGVADHLAITTEPVTTAAGATLLPAVAIQDQYDNTVTGDDRTITLTIQNNPGGASLNGTASYGATNGVATWTGTESLDITVAANGYTLRAAHDGAAFASSDTVDTAAFNITPNVADHLAIATEPVNTVVGAALVPAVSIEDQYGNTVTGDDRNITLAIQNDPSGGSAVLGGAKTRATISGVATWTGVQDLNITIVGSSYTLRASHDGAAFTTSDTVETAVFGITLGSADHLAITVQPVNSVAGVTLVPEVTIQDQFNNTVTGDNRTITLAIQANPGGATLNGTKTLLTVNGVAAWTGAEALNITTPGAGYTLRASHDGAAFVSSDTVDTAAINITPDVADHLAFSTEPANTAAGSALIPVVTIEDQFNNVVTNDARNITLAIQNNPGGTTLNGTVLLATTSGVAAWTAGEGLNITVAANGYALRASHDGAAFTSSDTVDSGAFNITIGVADHLEFIVQPAETAAGTALVPRVAIYDSFDNVVSGDDRNITLAILNNPGPGALNGTVSLATVKGVATWTAGEAMNITVPAVGYTLQASHDGAAFATSDTADSAAFTITTGVADHLAITVEPVNTNAGVTLIPEVAIEDSFNNTVTGDDRTVTLAIQTNPGGTALNGTVALATVNGVASWTAVQSLDITVAAGGYTLRASHNGAAFATSDTVDTAAFNITPGPADHLTVATEPANTVAGVALVPTVRIEDQYDNTVTDDNRNITLAIQTDPSGGAASLAGATSLPTSAGIATWTAVQDLNITAAFTGYTLRASHDGTAFATSDTVDTAAFNITAGTTDHLTFIPQPVNTTAGNTLQPDVAIQDQFNNTVTGDDRTITLVLEANPGGATLNGTAAMVTTNGRAAWTGVENLNLTVAASGYTLRATHDGAAFASSDTLTSAAFNITPDAADHLVVTTEPVNTTAGSALLPEIVIRDTYNNAVTGDNRNITLTIQNNPGTATLNGTASLATVNGIATWTGTESLDITVAANGYTLRASHDGAAFATSDIVDTASFNVVASLADHLAFTTQPANTMAGIALLPAITTQDQYDNTVTIDNRNITVAIQTDPSGGSASLAGVKTITSGNGVASWAGAHNLNLTVAASGYTLRASHDGSTFASSDTVDSATFNVTPSVADHLAVTTQPVNSAAGGDLVPVMAIKDQYNNNVTGDDRNITLAMQNNPGGATLNGTLSLSTTGGVATWTAAQSLDLTVAANGYTLRASHGGAGFATSDTVDTAAFNIASAAADHLVFTTEPAQTIAGVNLLPAMTIKDQFDNTVTTDDRTISLSIANDPGSATLNGTVSRATVGGIGTWGAAESLDITVAASGYTLLASHDGAAFATSDTATSAAFNITPGIADHLAYVTEPVTAAAGADLLPVVAIQDQLGNTVTNDNRSITLAIQNNPAGATLDGTTSLLTTGGLAAWTANESLDITALANGYTLRASHDGAVFTSSDTVDSAAFNITVGPVANFLVEAAPVSQSAGMPVTVTVTARDALKNDIANFDPASDINITVNAGGAGVISYADGAVGNVVIQDNGDGTATIDSTGAETFDANGRATFTISSVGALSAVIITVSDGSAAGNTNTTATNVTWSAPPAGPAPTHVTYEATATDASGRVVVRITVTDALPGEYFEITVDNSDPLSIRVAEVSSSAAPGTYVMTIVFVFTPIDLEAASTTPDKLEVLRFDETANRWVAECNNIGNADPTNILDECGYFVDSNDDVSAWAVMSQTGRFAVRVAGAPPSPPVPVDDRDQDGVTDAADNCPDVPNPTQADTDDDGVGNACDECEGPDDLDSDGDTIPDACDLCAGFDDLIDEDGDGVPAGCDACPEDPQKTEPGACGCGLADTDSNGNGIPDCGETTGDGGSLDNSNDNGQMDDQVEGNPPSAICGAMGSGCGTTGPSIILMLLGLLARRFVGSRRNG